MEAVSFTGVQRRKRYSVQPGGGEQLVSGLQLFSRLRNAQHNPITNQPK